LFLFIFIIILFGRTPFALSCTAVRPFRVFAFALVRFALDLEPFPNQPVVRSPVSPSEPVAHSLNRAELFQFAEDLLDCPATQPGALG